MSFLVDLDGVTAARGVVTSGTISLTLMSASGFSDQGYYPAESLTITEARAIEALRDLCDDLIRQYNSVTEAATLPPLPDLTEA